jgi:hypothetical protein
MHCSMYRSQKMQCMDTLQYPIPANNTVLLLMSSCTGRWDELDDSPVTWHIVGDMTTSDYNPFVTEPWQLAVNGVY